MELRTFFEQNTKAAIAFSGGVDSAYLLYAAVQSGARVCAYYVKTEFQPQFEYEDALRLARELGAEMKTIHLKALEDPQIAANPGNRCYYCKRRIFSAIRQAAAADDFDLLLDGTNASDLVSDRPGMKALQELEVRSPLRECGLTKPEIRRLSREAGLFTHDKPAYACLATRIPTGTEITPDKLERTELAEAYLMKLGFSDFRIRMRGDAALLQLRDDQMALLMSQRRQILAELKKYYGAVLLDLEVRGE